MRCKPVDDHLKTRRVPTSLPTFAVEAFPLLEDSGGSLPIVQGERCIRAQRNYKGGGLLMKLRVY